MIIMWQTVDEAYADQYFDKVCKECSGVSAELTFYYYIQRSQQHTPINRMNSALRICRYESEISCSYYH